MIYPTRGKVLVQNISDEKITAGGIIIADTVKEVPHRGKVLAIGLPKIDIKNKTKDWHFRIGDIVHYRRQWNQTALNYILLRDDIYAVESDKLEAPADYVIVRRHYTKTIGSGVIQLADSYGVTQNHSDFFGEIIAEGPESKFNFKKSDRIIYSRDEGSSFKYEGQEYFSLRPRAILAMAEL